MGYTRVCVALEELVDEVAVVLLLPLTPPTGAFAMRHRLKTPASLAHDGAPFRAAHVEPPSHAGNLRAALPRIVAPQPTDVSVHAHADLPAGEGSRRARWRGEGTADEAHGAGEHAHRGDGARMGSGLAHELT